MPCKRLKAEVKSVKLNKTGSCVYRYSAIDTINRKCSVVDTDPHPDPQ
jgi:hypothetical protein